MDRRNTPIRDFLLAVDLMENKASSQADDLKLEEEIVEGLWIRIWRSRVTHADGARLDHGVTVELRLDPHPEWIRVGEV